MPWSQEDCRWRYKCCWKSTADPNVPRCFFPSNWGYEVSDGSKEKQSTGGHRVPHQLFTTRQVNSKIKAERFLLSLSPSFSLSLLPCPQGLLPGCKGCRPHLSLEMMSLAPSSQLNIRHRTVSVLRLVGQFSLTISGHRVPRTPIHSLHSSSVPLCPDLRIWWAG